MKDIDILLTNCDILLDDLYVKLTKINERWHFCDSDWIGPVHFDSLLIATYINACKNKIKWHSKITSS